MHINAVVLAAGQGKRMKSKLYKVLHPLCGKPMVGHVVDTLRELQIKRVLVVVGFGAEAVKSYLGESAEYVFQEGQLGTGHAVLQAKPALRDEEGITIVICGDTPLIRSQTLEQMIRLHQEKKSAATILTASLHEPEGYGRIVRNENQQVISIVEQKDCNVEQAQLTEINTGTYCFDTRKLFAALDLVTNHNQQKEYYLTDVIRILAAQGEMIDTCTLSDFSESIGINDRVALAQAEQIMRNRINEFHMLQGVTIIDPQTTYIDREVQIGKDTVIYPQTFILGSTCIEEECLIGPQTEIRDSHLHPGVEVKNSIIHQSIISDSAHIGPFAYLRPGSRIGKNVKIGDFVEIKNTSIGDGSKVPHLSYVGDAIVGEQVNFGCGAITANYDGSNKHITTIGNGVFVGSNVNLIAPVTIGDRAYLVAGSTITKNVDADDLAIARERQTNKPGYASIIRNRKEKK